MNQKHAALNTPRRLLVLQKTTGKTLARALLSLFAFTALGAVDHTGAEGADNAVIKTNHHCLKLVKVKLDLIYMDINWSSDAAQKATSAWQSKARAKYGSPYGTWGNAMEKKAFCRRIGFGNDDKGNIGATVQCHYAAVPCARLIP